MYAETKIFCFEEKCRLCKRRRVFCNYEGLYILVIEIDDANSFRTSEEQERDVLESRYYTEVTKRNNGIAKWESVVICWIFVFILPKTLPVVEE